MKRLFYYLMSMAVAFAFFASCEDDEDKASAPEFTGAEISGNNAEITVNFSEGVYGDDAASAALTGESFAISLTGGAAEAGTFTVEHDAGEEIATITLDYSGVATGDEVVQITPASIYNADGVAMKDDQEETVQLAELGIVGEWYSSGDNVAQLLIRQYNVDSIHAKFEGDQTYLVESYDVDGVKTTYKGTFTQEKSDVEGIYTITLDQSEPSAVTSEGIFALFPEEEGYDLKYEVLQTQPSLNMAPPTPEGGFGSSADGNLGPMNIQQFIAM